MKAAGTLPRNVSVYRYQGVRDNGMYKNIRIPIHVEAILEFGKTRFQYFSNLGQRDKKVDDEEVWPNNGKSLPYSIHGWRHYGKAFEKDDEEGAN